MRVFAFVLLTAAHQQPVAQIARGVSALISCQIRVQTVQARLAPRL
jgi:hypothetical protein